MLYNCSRCLPKTKGSIVYNSPMYSMTANLQPGQLLDKTNPVITFLSWACVVSLVIVGHSQRIVYLYMFVAVILTMLLNSIRFKIFKGEQYSGDFIIYHFIMSLAMSLGTFLNALKLARLHQVIRTFNKVFTLLPYFGGSTYKDQLVEDVPIRIYTPKNPKSDAVVVYLHGGSFCLQTMNSYHSLMGRLCKEVGCVVVLVGIKQAPEFPFPNSLIESYQIVNWVQEHHVKLGVNKRRVVVMGDDSGGALAAAVSALHRDRQGVSLIHDGADLQPPIAAQVLLYPLLQAFSMGPDSVMAPLSEQSLEHQALFYSYYIAGNCTFQPYIGKADDEGVYPKFWSRCLDDAVKTRNPLTSLKPDKSIIWNEYAFPLMTGDPSGLPNTYVLGLVADEHFEEARCYSEWLTAHNVPTKMVREWAGYHNVLLMHSISGVARKIVKQVAEFVDETVC